MFSRLLQVPFDDIPDEHEEVGEFIGLKAPGIVEKLSRSLSISQIDEYYADLFPSGVVHEGNVINASPETESEMDKPGASVEKDDLSEALKSRCDTLEQENRELRLRNQDQDQDQQDQDQDQLTNEAEAENTRDMVQDRNRIESVVKAIDLDGDGQMSLNEV